MLKKNNKKRKKSLRSALVGLYIFIDFFYSQFRIIKKIITKPKRNRSNVTKTYMKEHKIIGLAGLAGSGKDLFCEVLRERDPLFERFALADELKRSVRDLFIEEYDIDVLSCTREEKDKIRPHLVRVAKERRFATEGRHWVNFLERKLIPLTSSVCITDIRYDDYDYDEVFWLQVQMDGALVHISRYDLVDGEKVFLSPPNEEEERNDPPIKDKADYVIEWPTFEGDKEALKVRVSEYVSDFLDWFPLWKQKKIELTTSSSEW